MNTTVRNLRNGLIFAIVLLAACAAQGSLVTVPGTANPYLAGDPNGTTANITDVAPAQSPVQVPISLTPGWWVEFSGASGSVANSPWFDAVTAGPEGDPNTVLEHAAGNEHSKSNVVAPIDALLGVFLDSSAPSGPAPSTLNFSTGASRDYLVLSPALKQVFFIGNGLTSGLVQQKVYIPSGATRLFLGVMDGEDWNNNPGNFSVDVNVVPEPATMAVLTLGTLLVLRRRRVA